MDEGNAASMPALQSVAERYSRWDADHCGRWMEEDLKEARELQILLLPHQVASPAGLAIAAGFRPAHGVTGDMYDLFECGDGRLVLIVGDVSGKGAAAALYGGVVSGLLRTMVASRCRPARLLQALNEVLLQRRAGSQSVSLLALSWQARSRRLALANAGVIRPLLCRKGEVLEVDLGGIPLGLWKDWKYEEVSMQMEPHDLVVLCSDGVTEQENPAGEQYDRRIAHLLRSTWQESPQSIVDAIFGDLDRFSGQPASDDQTLVVFRVT